MPLPRKPVDILVESFSEFFISNIVAIKASIGTDDSGDAAALQPSPLVMAPMDILHPATEQEIKCIIVASPNKQCALDPFPTRLVKSCKDYLLYFTLVELFCHRRRVGIQSDVSP